MDYGDRQDRALYLIKRFREAGDNGKAYTDYKGRVYTPAQMADEIEQETDLGKTMLAVAGIVFAATSRDPDLAARIFGSKST